MELRPIGRVRSTLTDAGTAPRQPDEGAPPAWLDLDDAVAAGLEGIAAGDELLVLTLLDRADREVLRVHPRGDPERPARLEALDGTPILDLKPVLAADPADR